MKVRKGRLFWSILKTESPWNGKVGRLFITSRGWKFVSAAFESCIISDQMPHVDGNELTWVDEDGNETCMFRACRTSSGRAE